MATIGQRAQAHCDAALNRPATLAEMNRLASALYDRAPVNDANGMPIPYDSLTNAQKAGVIVVATRNFYLSALRHADAEVAARVASLSAMAQVDIDWQEAP